MLFSTNDMKQKKKEIKIKICGILTPEDAVLVNTYRPDYAGMVLFYPRSKRNLLPEEAGRLLRGIRGPAPVAVMVEPSLEELRIAADLGFAYVQIHGGVEPDLLSEANRPVIRALNGDEMRTWELWAAHPKVFGFCLDANTPGSGKTADWALAAQVTREIQKTGKEVWLAGGMHAGNVAEALGIVTPDGVDVSSGVEYGDRPGKDPEKLSAFFRACGRMP